MVVRDAVGRGVLLCVGSGANALVDLSQKADLFAPLSHGLETQF